VELTLDPSIRYQTLLGFGGAFTDAAGELRPTAYGTEAASEPLPSAIKLSLALVAPSLMLQVSLHPEPMGMNLHLGVDVAYQLILSVLERLHFR
jgi:hypothetical protein